MIHLMMLLFYGLVVGLIAKAIHPKPNPVGWLSTLAVGIAGSYVGGFINWALGWGHRPFEMSGIFSGIVGGVLCLAAWRWWSLQNDPVGPRSFWDGSLKR